MKEIRLCFRIIHRLSQGYVSRHTRDDELTPSQIQALRHIAFHQVMSQQELVEDMGIDKAAVTRIVATLEKEGYVTRSADPNDGRAKRIHATEKANEIQEDVLSLERAYYRWLLEAVPEDEREQLEKNLNAMLERAREAKKDCYAALERERRGTRG